MSRLLYSLICIWDTLKKVLYIEFLSVGTTTVKTVARWQNYLEEVNTASSIQRVLPPHIVFDIHFQEKQQKI